MTTYQLPRLRPDRLSDEMVGGHALARIFWGYSDVSIPPQINLDLITHNYMCTIFAISIFLLGDI